MINSYLKSGAPQGRVSNSRSDTHKDTSKDSRKDNWLSRLWFAPDKQASSQTGSRSDLLNLSGSLNQPGLKGQPGSGQTVLSAQGLTVECPTANGTAQVLRDLSFELPQGQTLGLVGESGAGKSMLGRVIARQLPERFRVSDGSLTFAGENLLKVSGKTHSRWLGNRIAFIPQEPMTALNPLLTIGQQFREHMLRLGAAADSIEARMIQALEDVMLPRPKQLLDNYAFELSGGMCQRVLIAMAFVSQPELVISDEATTALDVSSQAQVIRLLRQLQERHGTSVLFVTHDMGLATHACDQVAVLYAGELMETGPSDTLFHEARHPYTRALKQATPSLDDPLIRLDALDGQMPGVEMFPHMPGCRFASRCPSVQSSCLNPVALTSSEGITHRQIRCTLYEPSFESCAQHDRQNGQQNAQTDQAQSEKPAHQTGQPFSDRSMLQLTGLSKSYPPRTVGAEPVQALAPLDLSVAPGEFIGIVGESGSGKSTLGKLLMGLETPSSGELLLNGKPLGQDEASWERRIRSIQMIFQDARSALNPRRKVGKLLTQPMDSRLVQPLERNTRMQDLARDVGLDPVTIGRFPTQLSGGQRQRVNIGRSLCDLPQLLIADEIVSGLDVSVQAQIMNLLLELRREHKVALVLISHDLSVVRYLCSKVLVMKQGHVVEQGPTEQVLGNPQHEYTRQLIAAVPPTDASACWPPELKKACTHKKFAGENA